ncbi:hypothetical protein [Aquimarina intermedia]|uniref:Uncharacterized protein n=1 Tax=Aquimarina intermedia TaxID=350814 RepID=A0A5S5BYM0_9FLAO|nr:hypothetical protein [Aquimarina intermedia]TYP72134.1 hypothetical protein BD809_10718 [Aquimarina intermedia]
MQNKLVLLIILSTTLLSAQDKPSVFKKNPFKQVTLHFRNGDTLKGIAKLNNFNKIIFKENVDDKKQIYDHKKIRGVTIYMDTVIRNFEYKIIREKTIRGKADIRYNLLEPVMQGKVSIYINDYEAKKGNLLGKNIGYTNYDTVHSFYIGKGTSDVVAPLGKVVSASHWLNFGQGTTVRSSNAFLKSFNLKFFYSNSVYTISDLDINPNSKYFKKIAKQYFKDCPELIFKIESGFFDKNGLVSVLNYYNKSCEN